MKRHFLSLLCCVTLLLSPALAPAQESGGDLIPTEEEIFSGDALDDAPPASGSGDFGDFTEDMFSEDDIFSDGNTVEAIEEHQDESVSESLEESLGFSGEIRGRVLYDVTRDALDGDGEWGDNPYSAGMEGDFLLDARWRGGIKAFADLWAGYTEKSAPAEEGGDRASQDDEKFDTILKEFFGDVNIKHRAYFRFGKQNLKWGQGYFWNPTDLVNEDRKDFQDLNRRREGVFGLKTHIPFGTAANLYAFLDMNDADTSQDFAFAGKFEFLVFNDIEMALSAWSKHNHRPVFGFDVSTYEFGTQWRGELSLTKGGNQRFLEKQNGEYVEIDDSKEWIPRVTFGFTRNFDVGDFTDRFSLTGEFFYNHKGYEENMLEDETLRGRFIGGGYYQPNYYGKYYAAVFTDFGRFLNNSDLSLGTNLIGNLSDSSFMLDTSLRYQMTFNASLTTRLSASLGAENREYTMSGNAMGAEVLFNLVF